MRREIGYATLRTRLSELARVQTKNENTFRGGRKIRFRNFLSSVAVSLQSSHVSMWGNGLSHSLSSLKSKSVQQRAAIPTPPPARVNETHIESSLWLCHFVSGRVALCRATAKKGCLTPVFAVEGSLKWTKSTLVDSKC